MDFLQLRVIHIITKLVFDVLKIRPVPVTGNLHSLAEAGSMIGDEFFRCC